MPRWGQGAHNALYIVGDFYRRLLREFRKLDSDYPPPHARPGTLGAFVDRVERLIYGIRPAAGKFGRRSEENGGLDSPFLEEIVNFTGRIEQWFGGSKPTPPAKPSPKSRPRPLPPPRPPPSVSGEQPLLRDELPDWSEPTLVLESPITDNSGNANREQTPDAQSEVP